VAAFFASQRPRRLPVFFLLDTSVEMGGTFQVTMQDGLQVVKSQLTQHALAAQCVYLAGILSGEHATEYGLVPLEVFHIPAWEAQGTCVLQPALAKLSDALMFDLIAPRPGTPGDYSPLIFLVLGSKPADDGAWQKTASALTMAGTQFHPLIVSLVTRPELANVARTFSQHVLVLTEVEALYMSTFFFWITQTIAKICEDSERGMTAIEFPALPFGIVVPQ
jgi:uncharacterized protein YegL